MKLLKIQVKVYHEHKTVWEHFCYVPDDLKARFDSEIDSLSFRANVWISKWAYDDFELLEIDTPEGLQALKEAIRRKYKEKYPELYLDSGTDKQGWLRRWYSENMEMELKSLGK